MLQSMHVADTMRHTRMLSFCCLENLYGNRLYAFGPDPTALAMPELSEGSSQKTGSMLLHAVYWDLHLLSFTASIQIHC
jgi:hypothetical protein